MGLLFVSATIFIFRRKKTAFFWLSLTTSNHSKNIITHLLDLLLLLLPLTPPLLPLQIALLVLHFPIHSLFNNCNSPVCISKYFDGTHTYTQSNVEHNACTIPDLWILHKLSLLLESANKYFDNYQLFKLTEAWIESIFLLKNFVSVL